MSKALIVALALVVTLAGVVGGEPRHHSAKARFTAPVVPVVYIGPSERWRLVERAVADLNAAMPPDRTVFVAEHGGDRACTNLPKRYKRIPKQRVFICNDPTLTKYAGTASTPWRRVKGVNVIVSADIRIHPSYWSTGLLCHELMHAVANVPDHYGANPDGSCVHGDLSAPGSWDRAQLATIYHDDVQQPGKRKNKRRK